MNYRVIFILILILLPALTLFVGDFALAETCPAPPAAPVCSGSWTETQYRCSAQCEAEVLQRNRGCSWSEGNPLPITDEDGCIIDYNGCDSPRTSGCGDWGAGSAIESCGSWQGCGNTDWNNTKNTCQCAGNCLETPQNPRYYDNPTYSDQPDKDIGNKDIKLPVKLDWDDVKGWGQEGGPKSYALNATTPNGAFSLGPLEKSEYIPEACFFPSNKTSNWGAKACCGADGADCGSASSWSLGTNLAPELVSPADPDWAGDSAAENITTPVTLDWCNVQGAQSYRFRTFIIENNMASCHPTLKAGNQCDSWLLEKERRDPEEIEKTVFSDFSDGDFYFFTEDTAYQWEILTCADDDGLNCAKPGQLWGFATAKDASPKKLAPLSPPNDPAGEKPVGLPLVLDWITPPQMKSFIYQMDFVLDNTGTSQSKSFDYPQLSLNTFYGWKVKGCFDYKAENCEENFSEEWIFKTTGQPPVLSSPAANETNVAISVEFSWEAVPGAKSYVLKILGDNFSLEKTTNDQLVFSLGYPEYNIRQEKNYSWQVKTCAWKNGQTCGQFSPGREFKTFRLPVPQNPSPENGGQMLTDERFLSWGKISGAKAYQYKIQYLSVAAAERDDSCQNLAGQEVVPAKTILSNLEYLQLKCLGGYQWQAAACLDENCTETSNWSGPWTFDLIEPVNVGRGGLVPCGRAVDNPETPWSEREPCGAKHFILLIKILIDFLFGRIIPFGLVLLTMATGIILYLPFSHGDPLPLARIKSLWRSAIIGIIIISFAWPLINLFLKLIGYQIGIFGQWYIL